MEGVCANAARAWHPDNLPTLPVDGPRTFRTLRTLSVSRRRCLTASMHCKAHCAAAAAASRRARLGRKQCARGEALPLKSARDIRNHPCPLLPPLPLIDAVMQHTRFPIPCLSRIRILERWPGGERRLARNARRRGAVVCPLKNLGQPARVALKRGYIALYSPAKLLSHQPVHGRGA